MGGVLNSSQGSSPCKAWFVLDDLNGDHISGNGVGNKIDLALESGDAFAPHGQCGDFELKGGVRCVQSRPPASSGFCVPFEWDVP